VHRITEDKPVTDIIYLIEIPGVNSDKIGQTKASQV